MPSSDDNKTGDKDKPKKRASRRKTTNTNHLTPDAPTRLSLGEVLSELGLDHAASELDAASQKAITRNDPPTALLDKLMRDQLRAQMEYNAGAAIRRSNIFPLTTLEQYDFDYPDEIDKEAVMQAASLDFVENKTNCVFVGPSGVGKTHLSNALGQLACIKGYNVRFTLAADLVNDLVASAQRNTLARRLSAWTRPDLVLIDELGYLSFDARGADLLYQVFNRRYQRASTIVTTNLPFKDWGTLFHNAAAASAIADRLVHTGTLVSIKGKSRRSDREVD
jgi:DNA replication protein DnaC